MPVSREYLSDQPSITGGAETPTRGSPLRMVLSQDPHTAVHGLNPYETNRPKLFSGDMAGPSVWEQISYGYARTDGMAKNLTKLAGDIVGPDYTAEEFDDPEEYSPEKYDPAETAQRRTLRHKMEEAELAREHPKVHGTEFADSGWVMAGDIMGALSDVSTAIPVGAGAKTGYKMMAALGGTWSATDLGIAQLERTGELEPTALMAAAATGAIMFPASMWAARGISSKLRKRAANKFIDEIERTVAQHRVDGKAAKEAVKLARQEMGFTTKEMLQAVEFTGRKVRVMSQASSRKALQDLHQGLRYKIHMPEWLDGVIGTVSTRIGKISAPIKSRLRKYEFDTHVDTHKYLEKTKAWRQGIHSLDKPTHRALSKALFNGDAKAVHNVLSTAGRPDLIDEYKVVQDVYDDLFKKLKSVRYDLDKLDNYYHRQLKDPTGLREKMGRKNMGVLEEIRRDYAKSGKPLGVEQEAKIINKLMRGYSYRMTKSGPSFIKDRTMPKIPSRYLDFYAPPEEALETYIRKAVVDVHKRKFFGYTKPAVYGTDDFKESVGYLLATHGIENPKDVDLLERLINARFTLGEQPVSKWVAHTKNILYGITLGNPISAATQIGDLGIAAYMNGFRNTVAAVFGKKYIKAFDLGLTDAAVEFTSPAKSQAFMQWAFKWGGFSMVDRFGKTTLLNGALRKSWNQLAKGNKAGEAAFRKKWGRVFGSELDGLIKDLRSKNMSDNVKLMLWNTLSDAQPIALSEMPEAYLSAGGKRVLYMLKTFTIKQLDIIRRDVMQQIRTNPRKGMANLVKFTTMFTAANMGATVVKHWLRGDLDEQEVSDLFIDNLYKNFGASNRMAKRWEQGALGTAVGELITPPLNALDSIFFGGKQLMEGETPTEVLKSIPPYGKLFYYRLKGKDAIPGINNAGFSGRELSEAGSIPEF